MTQWKWGGDASGPDKKGTNPMNHVKVDDRSGLEVARMLDGLVKKKCRAPVTEMLLLGVLAGIYIGFGAMGATTVTGLGGLPPALSKFLAASVFCVGLILVIIPGSELFTGNILMVASLVNREVSATAILRNWSFVYVGNFLGSVLLALAIFGAGLLGTPEEPSAVGRAAAAIAEAKIDLGLFEAFLRGVLCNMLVCLAVILALASRTVAGKILGIYFPIMVFVLCGYEHSIANMYFLPAGLLAKGRFLADFWSMFHNLVPVTLGNILGGMLVVLLHPARAKRILNPPRPAGAAPAADEKAKG
jgi:formate/nitrite transporter